MSNIEFNGPGRMLCLVMVTSIPVYSVFLSQLVYVIVPLFDMLPPIFESNKYQIAHPFSY